LPEHSGFDRSLLRFYALFGLFEFLLDFFGRRARAFALFACLVGPESLVRSKRLSGVRVVF
jgi:hypothetical protein